MDILWTPWRIDYILSKKEPGCVFCKAVHDDPANDESNLLLYRGEHCFIIMNLYPYNTGHVMVVPYLHTNDLPRLETATMQEMGDLTQRVVALMKEILKPDGYNLGMNLGRVAGAGIDDHLHQHIVPRWGGDTNFMPVLAETHTMPELLPDTFAKLKARLTDFFPARGSKARDGA
jgi:ATP adenylyltransferase